MPGTPERGVVDGHRAGAAVGYTGVPLVRGEAEAAIRGNLHVVGKHAYPEIDLAVGYLLPVNVELGDLVDRILRGQCMLPVGGDRDGRDGIAHGHRVDELDLFAVDREHADRIVGAIGDQEEVALPLDREARGRLADLDSGNQLRERRLQIDDEELVVGYWLPAGPCRLIGQRIGNQGQALVRRDREVGRRARSPCSSRAARRRSSAPRGP